MPMVPHSGINWKRFPMKGLTRLMTALRAFVYAMWIAAAPFSCAEARDLMDILGVSSSIDQAANQMQALIDHAREAASPWNFRLTIMRGPY
jgi:hypothetical protein